MPPVRQSQRVRREVEPYQAAGPPQVNIRQQRRRNARYEQRREPLQAARNGVPTTYEEIQRRIRHDDRDPITNKLPATIREIAGGQMTKISVSLGDDGTQFHHAHSKYNLGDFNIRPHFDAYSLLRSDK
jgi:hypothetical protein